MDVVKLHLNICQHNTKVLNFYYIVTTLTDMDAIDLHVYNVYILCCDCTSLYIKGNTLIGQLSGSIYVKAMDMAQPFNVYMVT